MNLGKYNMLAVLMTCGPVLAGDDPFVSNSFTEACEQAAKDKRVVFVDFVTSWCAPCKVMEKTTFRDEKVVEWLTRLTVALRIDAEKETKLAEKYGVDTFPTLLFVKPDGSEIDRIVGGKTAEEFLAEAADILAGKDGLTRAREKLKAAGENDPMAKMDFARALAQRGKYEEALAELLWCYDEGLKHNMAFAGVRVSFLLAQIAELGRKHPPALAALRERRDAAAARVAELKGSPFDMMPVMELASLNEHVGEPEKTLQLYDKLRTEHPKWLAVGFLRERVFDQLLAAHRYAELAESIDFEAEIEQEIAMNKMSGSFMSKEQREQLAEYERRALVDTIAKYYQVLIGVKNLAEAEKLADRALKIDESAQTYNALAWNGYVTGTPIDANVQQARRAHERTNGRDAAVIDTLARVLAATGQTAEACQVVKDGIEKCQEGQSREILRACGRDLKCE